MFESEARNESLRLVYTWSIGAAILMSEAISIENISFQNCHPRESDNYWLFLYLFKHCFKLGTVRYFPVYLQMLDLPEKHDRDKLGAMNSKAPKHLEHKNSDTEL